MKAGRWVIVGMLWAGVMGMLQAQSVTVLCYHTFLGNPRLETDFSIAEFSAHIRIMREKGYRFVTFEAMKKGQITGSRNVLLVIDDGNRSAYDAYQQVLRPQGIPTMFAIYPGIIGSRRFAMTWEQLQSAVANGAEVASHGYFHEFLSEAFKAKRPQDFENEVRLSQKILSQKLDRPIQLYVYPFGVFSVSGKQLLKASGYHHAMTIQPGPTLIPLSRNANPLQLPRTMLTRANAKRVLEQL